METRVALIGIMVEKSEAVEMLNSLLSQYKEFIIGRMGIPYQKKGISLISIAIDAPADEISALSGKIGRLAGVSAKVIYQKA
ncbi:putative iron-only hydrogenase system regulator [Lachnotalea glycerini]|jgi:putative iron-only hydrogenase system regulator|uniref:Iron-only hydrogenase system regulator n=1 Tax=Lachnotalea glycerini TaxID=1763509 RepID=A0A255IMF0_9FIRM|nr:TM1266 family iron-only hydrogenase system putative regulator [Lachnotalea glycerini]PXV85689.1 putative iron-only hydrogenase system regulator [Lachnotalea glycerini]RDY31365.1 iron-only hydrogenase system regulator [Lachnotalea glycerini]